MSRLSTLTAAIKVDVNNDESIIINYFYRLLRNMFTLIKWFGIPFILYLVLQFTKLF